MRRSPNGALDPKELLERFVRDERQITLPDDPYLRAYLTSYPEFLRFFRTPDTLGVHHLIAGAGFAHAWMPCVLQFKSRQFDEAVTALNRARAPEPLEAAELDSLVGLVNNSVSGASKLLHFVNPDVYMIWDKWVGKWLGRRLPTKKGKAEFYLECLRAVRAAVGQPEFDPCHESVCRKIMAAVSRIRAADLIMFVTAKAELEKGKVRE